MGPTETRNMKMKSIESRLRPHRSPRVGHSPFLLLWTATGMALLACDGSTTDRESSGAGTVSSAVETRIGPLETEVGYYTNATARRLYDEMDFQRATQAYMWAFPLVSSQSIKVGLSRDLGVNEYDLVLYEN